MPSGASSTPGRVEAANDYEPDDLNTTAVDIDQGIEQDEADVADRFTDDMDDLADIEADILVNAVIAGGADRHSAQMFTSTFADRPNINGSVRPRPYHG